MTILTATDVGISDFDFGMPVNADAPRYLHEAREVTISKVRIRGR
jgi:hypothetical protein